MDRKKKPEWKLPEEVRIVNECSPNLMPCKKFLHANIFRFSEHMKKDKMPTVHRVVSTNGKGTTNDSTVGGVAEEQE
jgi:hypothetical protein